MEIGAPRLASVDWLLGALVAGDGPESAEVPAGGSVPAEVVADLALIPPGAAARFAVPASDPRVAARSLLAFNGLRPPAVRAQRAALAAACRLGALRAVRQRIVVRARADERGDALADRWLPEHLRQVLDVRELQFAVGLSFTGVFAKPTLQVFDEVGRPLAYAKVGFDDPTRAVVRREAELLETLAETAPVVVPALLYDGTWHGRHLTVTAPLPARTRRVPSRRWPCAGTALALARRGGVRVLPLGDAPWAHHARVVARAVDSADGTATSPAARDEVLAALDRFERCAAVETAHGMAHGDWVPWNLGRVGAQVVVWDWELALGLAPFGLDLVHWAYQQRVVVQGRPGADGAAAAPDDARPHLQELGVSGPLVEAVAAAHHLQLLTREIAPTVGLPPGPDDPVPGVAP